MRKPMMALLSLALLLNGCGGTASQPPASGGPPAAMSDTSTMLSAAPAAEILHFQLDRKSVSEDWKQDAADDVLLARYFYAIPTLQVVTEDGAVLEEATTQIQRQALEIAATFNTQFTDWVESVEFDKLGQWAEEAYEMRRAEGLDWAGFYEEEFTYGTWRTDRLISVAGQWYSYTGGAHPNTMLLGWNYDLEAGRFLHATSLGADPEALQIAVTEEIIRQAEARAAEQGVPADSLYWEEYQDIAAQWADYAVSFSDGGMTVSFSAYEMAAYAAGPQVFEISFDMLAPYLSDDGMELLGLAEADS